MQLNKINLEKRHNHSRSFSIQPNQNRLNNSSIKRQPNLKIGGAGSHAFRQSYSFIHNDENSMYRKTGNFSNKYQLMKNLKYYIGNNLENKLKDCLIVKQTASKDSLNFEQFQQEESKSQRFKPSFPQQQLQLQVHHKIGEQFPALSFKQSNCKKDSAETQTERIHTEIKQEETQNSCSNIYEQSLYIKSQFNFKTDKQSFLDRFQQPSINSFNAGLNNTSNDVYAQPQLQQIYRSPIRLSQDPLYITKPSAIAYPQGIRDSYQNTQALLSNQQGVFARSFDYGKNPIFTESQSNNQLLQDNQDLSLINNQDFQINISDLIRRMSIKKKELIISSQHQGVLTSREQKRLRFCRKIPQTTKQVSTSDRNDSLDKSIQIPISITKPKILRKEFYNYYNSKQIAQPQQQLSFDQQTQKIFETQPQFTDIPSKVNMIRTKSNLRKSVLMKSQYISSNKKDENMIFGMIHDKRLSYN